MKPTQCTNPRLPRPPPHHLLSFLQSTAQAPHWALQGLRLSRWARETTLSEPWRGWAELGCVVNVAAWPVTGTSRTPLGRRAEGRRVQVKQGRAGAGSRGDQFFSKVNLNFHVACKNVGTGSIKSDVLVPATLLCQLHPLHADFDILVESQPIVLLLWNPCVISRALLHLQAFGEELRQESPGGTPSPAVLLNSENVMISPLLGYFLRNAGDTVRGFQRILH